MVESNKILTVSYGTFSCTLEGFDDAFDTMKAIAEYFRDLAADDRYFGAEPPTPDAEMLTRLAERNSTRRVRARTEEGNIVLSPDQEKKAQTEAPSATPSMETPAEAEPVEATAPGMAADDPPAAEAPDAAAPLPEASPEAEDWQDMPPRPMRAPRIAAALAAAGDAALLAADDTLDTTPRSRTAPLQPPAAETRTEASSDDAPHPAPTLPEVEAPILERPAHDQPEAVDAPVDDAPDAEQHSANGAVPEAASDLPKASAPAQIADEAAADDIPQTGIADEEPVEGDLELADEPEAASPADLPMAESEVLSAPAEAIDAPLPAAEEDVLPATSADTAIPEVDLTPSGEGWDSIAEAAEAIAIARAEPEDGEELPHASPGTTDVALKLQRIRDVVARRRAAAEALLTPAAAEPVESEAEETALAEEEAAQETGDISAEIDAAPIAQSEGATAIVEHLGEAHQDETGADVTPRPMARIIKVKRREPGESSLSAAEEDDLQRELAAIEAEAAPNPAPVTEDETSVDPMHDAVSDPDIAPDATEADLQPARAGLGARSLRDTDHGAQMDRILRETDNQFEQADSTRRRSALAHLRAAVAAKKAEKEAGSDFAPREDTTDAYREDLAQVVRPRRPAIAHQSSSPAARRTPARPAPLKLVAEQRIDVSGGGQQGRVQPRRVSIADLARKEESVIDAQASSAPEESFAEYARAVGARSLGELLEAAASYMSFMEHQRLFSRPQLMSRVKSLQPEGFSREDGLRAFGQLLREGKIRKAEAGRFSVSDSIGFRPEERAAG